MSTTKHSSKRHPSLALYSDFRTYVTQPYLLITTLRNPLELMVSATQFKHRDETRTLEEATSYVEARMRDHLT